MATITFVHPDGRRTQIIAKPGQSVMQAATMHGIEEIVAQCGGSLVCGTCHVFVDETDLSRLQRPSALEDELLDYTMAPRRPTSRLACQVIVEHDITVILPDRQI